MARYGQEFKDRAVARLLPPESAAVEVASRELGVAVATLERWRADAMSMPARERAWTAAARFEAVLATAAMDEASKNAWCRENGVYPQELEQWRTAATQALAEPEDARATHRETKADRRRIKELERELRRKEKARAIEKIRLEQACRLIETRSQSMKMIALACGFSSEEVMRRAFLRILRVSPADYRERFFTPKAGQ
ncbi:helix-turn-helix domain-containing protein [Cupriavidus sp. KK10]|uniref:helix-turn-helix domain-containing protein n=1 Tax=Cupriavidus sp. KK10 TaxID=1478019 RepID=UPI0035303693